ncbi:MAG: hypothetical protein ACOZBZ_04000 [Patescibacteria group bacterium]
MVGLAIVLGIYSYLILALGLLGWLYRLPVFLVSLPFLVAGFFWIRKNWHFNYLNWVNLGFWGLWGLLGIQVLINFLGAISPELSFDALWYHLTPPKLYVQNHQIFYIPGWLLWPANLPRFTEMFYTVALLFSNEILAKLIHFSFGILAAVALFNLLKRYLSLRLSLLGVLTFYTMLMVGWQSTTAYVDLTRTFFEILALDLFLKWIETKKENFLWEAGILTGLAISTKILAFGTLGTFGILILLVSKDEKFKRLVKFVLLALLVASPWLVLFRVAGPGLSWIAHDPGLSWTTPWLIQNLSKLPLLLWNATIHPDDIISPVYLIFLPLVLIFILRQKLSIKTTALYCLLGAFFAPAASNRYLLPYLPGLTLLTFAVLDFYLKQKKILYPFAFNLQGVIPNGALILGSNFNHKIILNSHLKTSVGIHHFAKSKQSGIEKLILGIVIFSALLNTGSRGLATRKFLPYLLGQENKTQFLVKHLNFSFGDFYDADGWFSRNIKKDDLVLIYGIHNLYYVDFPYVHESYALPGTYFTHILVGDNQRLPEKFGPRLLLYQNPKTQVKLYLFGEKYQ